MRNVFFGVKMVKKRRRELLLAGAFHCMYGNEASSLLQWLFFLNICRKI